MVKREGRSLFIREGFPTGDLHAAIGPEPFRAGWIWDGESLTVETDRFGLQPLFYRQDGNSIGVSFTIDPLRRSGDEFDWTALGLFFRLAFFLDNDTPFRAIRRVPADTVLRWKEGILTMESRPRPAVRSYTGSREKAMDTYIEVFRESLKELIGRFPGMAISCPLSGGRDSRHIMLELARMGAPVHAYTLDVDNANDAPVASPLCAQYGVPHTIVPMAPLTLAAAEWMNSSSQYSTLEHRWLIAMVDAVPAGVLLDGVAGDVLSAGHFSGERILSQFRQSRLEELAEELLMDDEAIRMLLQPWLYAKMSRQEARQRLVKELARHVDTPSPVASFFLANRTRRVAALTGTCLYGNCQGLMPFLLDPVYDFLFTLPGEMTVDFQLHTDTLARAFPECRHPYSQKHKGRTERLFMAEGLRESRHWGGIVNRGASLARLLRGCFDGPYSLRSDWLVSIPHYLHQIGVGR